MSISGNPAKKAALTGAILAPIRFGGGIPPNERDNFDADRRSNAASRQIAREAAVSERGRFVVA